MIAILLFYRKLTYRKTARCANERSKGQTVKRMGIIGMAAASTLWAAQGVPLSNPLPDPEAVVIENLVVRASLPGPAWWKVERGGSVVYVLGLPDAPFPKAQAWDRAVLQRRLTGATVLITPVKASAGLGDIPALLSLRGKLKSATPLEDSLPATLRDRFVAARNSVGQPAGRYRSWKPLYAGQMLLDDFHALAGTDRREPLATISVEARRLKVPLRPAGTYRAVGFLNPAIDSLTAETSEDCLGEALDEVKLGAEALRAAGSAWAQGDAPGVLAGPRGFASCLLLLSGGTEFWRRTIDQEADAVAQAMEQPGHAVAVFPLRAVLARDGVLDRLRSKGFAVTAEGHR
jgi:hypothetical protein